MENRFDKKGIEETFDKIQKITDEDGYLDHAIRAIEAFFRSELRRICSITKMPSNHMRKGKGKLIICKNGADILYPKEGECNEIRFTIAHELGHLLLHRFDEFNQPVREESVVKSPKLETQATYFAKLILKHRSGIYLDRNHVKRLALTEEDIEKLIKRCHNDYDEKLLN